MTLPSYFSGWTLLLSNSYNLNNHAQLVTIAQKVIVAACNECQQVYIGRIQNTQIIWLRRANTAYGVYQRIGVFRYKQQFITVSNVNCALNLRRFCAIVSGLLDPIILSYWVFQFFRRTTIQSTVHPTLQKS